MKKWGIFLGLLLAVFISPIMANSTQQTPHIILVHHNGPHLGHGHDQGFFHRSYHGPGPGHHNHHGDIHHHGPHYDRYAD